MWNFVNFPNFIEQEHIEDYFEYSEQDGIKPTWIATSPKQTGDAENHPSRTYPAVG